MSVVEPVYRIDKNTDMYHFLVPEGSYTRINISIAGTSIHDAKGSVRAYGVSCNSDDLIFTGSTRLCEYKCHIVNDELEVS